MLLIFLFAREWLPSKSDWEFYGLWALAVLALVAFKKWRERLAQAWPIVQGTVEWTQVRVEDSRHGQVRIPEVCYSYSVNGEYYSGSYGILEADFDKFPNGSRILVHYKPSDPCISFLDLKDVQAHKDASEPVG